MRNEEGQLRQAHAQADWRQEGWEEVKIKFGPASGKGRHILTPSYCLLAGELCVVAKPLKTHLTVVK